MTIKNVSAATMFDVLHDAQYRKKWDPTVSESFDIARLSANADVGYYSCEDSLICYICSHSSLFVCVCLSESDPPETWVGSEGQTQFHLLHKTKRGGGWCIFR